MTQLSYDTARSRGRFGHCAAVDHAPGARGGAGDKIFPPTFGETVAVPPPLEGNSAVVGRRTKYGVEWRRVKGASRLCVLLDSVALQANRTEESLRDAWDSGESAFPLVPVDFTGARHEDPALDLSTLGDDGYLSVLEVPHRLSDALLRDSLLDGVPFRASDQGTVHRIVACERRGPLRAMSHGSGLGRLGFDGAKRGLGAK